MLPRISPRGYARITLGAAIALAVIIVTGAGVRVTGSGLGCPQWPTCEANHVVAPLHWHPIIEFANRVFTGVVSVLVILAVLGSLVRTPRRKDLTWLSLSLVFGVAAQAVLGGIAVIYELKPQFVMAHFLLSMILLWSAILLHHRANQPDSPAQPVVHRDYILLGRLLFLVAAAVLFVGTMVTGTGPHGGDEHVQRLGFSPHQIARVHGTLVWTLIALTAFTVWRLHSIGATSTLIKRGETLIAVMILQGAGGYLQYALHVPAALVLFHVAGATTVWSLVIWLNLGFYERYGEIGLKAYDGDVIPALDDVFGMPSAPAPAPPPASPVND